MKYLAPIEAKTEIQLDSLQTEMCHSKDYWLNVGKDKIDIWAQVNGEAPMAEITIPRRVFNQMVRWYLRKQRVRVK